MSIGTIVTSDSHINYICQVYGPREVESSPKSADYAFGHFVRIAVRHEQPDASTIYASAVWSEPQTYAVGVITDTILLNPAFGSVGPRLLNGSQMEIFSPDALSAQGVLVHILLLGMIEGQQDASGATAIHAVMQGVPPCALAIGSVVKAMSDEQVRAFHLFCEPGAREPHLHLGYLPHLLAQHSSLSPMLTLRLIDQLERLFPEQRSLLAIITRNVAWRVKVEATG